MLLGKSLIYGAKMKRTHSIVRVFPVILVMCAVLLMLSCSKATVSNVAIGEVKMGDEGEILRRIT